MAALRGLVKAVHEQLLGSAWQLPRVHFTRNAQDLVPRLARRMVATVIRSIFEQPDEARARAQPQRVVDGLEARFPAVAALFTGSEADLLVYFTFPDGRSRQIRSRQPGKGPATSGRVSTSGTIVGLGVVRKAHATTGSRSSGALGRLYSTDAPAPAFEMATRYC